MGRINLTALRVRKRALANLETKATKLQPGWLDIVGDIPPAQILTRQQPQQQPLTRVRTRSLPPSSQSPSASTLLQKYTITAQPRKAKSAKPSRLFSPVQIRYEEDGLRKQFFSDHPWELARPRVVLETSGDSHRDADWSTGLVQAGIPLSGESVVQRQLWLLQNTPDISTPQAYDLARREFYDLRRQEDTRRRIAAEEAEAHGAVFGRSPLQWGMQLENDMYDDWERWSRLQVVEQMQRSAAFAGETMKAEQEVLKEEDDDQQPEPVTNSRIGVGVFEQEAKRQGAYSSRA